MSGFSDLGPGKSEDREEGQFLSSSPYLSHPTFHHKPKAKKMTGTSLERAIDERNQAQHFLSLLETQYEAQSAKLTEEAEREVHLQEQLKKKRGLNEYQMAFLMIQNAVGAIIKTCRGNHGKVLTYAVQRWRLLSTGKRAKTVLRTQSAVRLIRERLHVALRTADKSRKSTMKSAVQTWFFVSNLRKVRMDFERRREEKLKAQKKEVTEGEKEMQALSAKQTAMEQTISELMQNEKAFKETIVKLKAEREAIGASRAHLEAETKEQNRAQEARLERRLEELERENQELQEKMSALENNVVFFIKEMSGLIDFQENLRTTEKDSPAHRGSRPTLEKKGDRRARNLNLDF